VRLYSASHDSFSLSHKRTFASILHVTKTPSEYSRHAPRVLPPLSPLTYYRRNLARTLPVGGAIAISVFLISSIVTLLNSVDQSILVNYGFLQRFSALTSQFETEPSAEVVAKTQNSKHLKKVISSVPYFITIQTVFGRMPVPIYGLDTKDAQEMAALTGNTLVAGRWPLPNEPEIVLTRAWANNKKLKIGQSIEIENERLPTLSQKQKLVGILEGGENFAIADKSYVLLEMPSAVIRTSLIFVPKSRDELGALNKDVSQVLDAPRHHGLPAGEAKYVQLYTFEKLVKELRKTLGFLYTFLAVADALVIGAVALLSGFLANIYFEQRLAEFGLLSAFGFRRERLARRLIIESGALVVAGWIGGLLLSFFIFRGLDIFYMQPNGLVLSHINQSAILYTLPTPIIVGLASLGTVLFRLYRLDPIEIMERR
jgi:ABC-type lipoprotein release transport system permease subunit